MLMCVSAQFRKTMYCLFGIKPIFRDGQSEWNSSFAQLSGYDDSIYQGAPTIHIISLNEYNETIAELTNYCEQNQWIFAGISG